MPVPDYSVYLVTDSGLVPPGKTLYEQVKASLEGGATIVQLREKTAETRDFIEIARAIHELTKHHDVPLIINDRLDVALAIDAEGVHVGQDDMDIATLRQYLGPDKIVGVSVSNVEEARLAIRDKADYVGIGAVYGTQTKDLKKAPMGASGVRDILNVLANECPYDIKTVAIGGINHSNTEVFWRLAHTPQKPLDGIAIVSAIIAAPDAKDATQRLAQMLQSGRYNVASQPAGPSTAESLLAAVPDVVARAAKTSPLVHHITNGVVKNFSANVTIAAHASPAMSECPQEFDEFASVPDVALLLNMGTATADNIEMFQQAIRAYNGAGKPVVFDPVGCGASTHRRRTCAAMLNTGVLRVIKGNEGEITAAARAQGAAMRGVDSVGAATDTAARVAICTKLAAETRAAVLMTGAEDVLVDASRDFASPRAFAFSNGHKYMGCITGSGCSLGSLIATMSAVEPDSTLATAAGLLLYTLAAERAASLPDVRGPGTFVPAFIDAIYQIVEETLSGDHSWLRSANVTAL